MEEMDNGKKKKATPQPVISLSSFLFILKKYFLPSPPHLLPVQAKYFFTVLVYHQMD